MRTCVCVEEKERRPSYAILVALAIDACLCNVNGIPLQINLDACIRMSGVGKRFFGNEAKALRNILGLDRKVTVKDLGVQFNCPPVASDAQKILDMSVQFVRVRVRLHASTHQGMLTVRTCSCFWGACDTGVHMCVLRLLLCRHILRQRLCYTLSQTEHADVCVYLLL